MTAIVKNLEQTISDFSYNKKSFFEFWYSADLIKCFLEIEDNETELIREEKTDKKSPYAIEIINGQYYW